MVVLDKSARDSIQNFESGIGDVAITYENEVMTAQEAGGRTRRSTRRRRVMIENPVAVVDANVDKHCVRDIARRSSPPHARGAGMSTTSAGFLRSTDIDEAKAGDGDFPPDRGPVDRRGPRRVGRA